MIEIYKLSDLVNQLKQNKLCDFESLRFKLETRKLIIIGWTKQPNPHSITKSTCKKELDNIKQKITELTEISSDFHNLIDEIDIEYILADDYGWGGVPICKENEEKIKWMIDFS